VSPLCPEIRAQRRGSVCAVAKSAVPSLTGSWSRGRTTLRSSTGDRRSSSRNADCRREREIEGSRPFPEVAHMQDIPETGVTLRRRRGSADVRVWYARVA